MALGVTVTNRTAPASRGVPTDTGTAFVTGSAGSAAPTDEPILVRSVGDFVAADSARDTDNAELYDWLDGYFREGGQRAYVACKDSSGGTIDSALSLFSKDLGPGQVAATDETNNAATFGKLFDHAYNNNRVALGDVVYNSSIATMETLGGTIPSQNSSYGAVFGPWIDVPAPAGTIGQSGRQIPASAVIAALCNRVDRLGNPNRAAAGRDFPLQYGTGPTIVVSDTDRETLLDAGINTIAEVFGVLQNYGFQTGIEQNPDNPFWQFNVARARMWLTARAQAVGETFMFKPIDGRGHLQSALKRALEGVCKDLYDVDGLYGATPADAFAVEVGASVNTVDTIAQGELHGVAEAVFSLHSKAVMIDLVSIPITGSVSQAQ